MKFFKTKAVAALSITLLLSTQTKPMGHDAELALQAPMAQASVEVIKPSLTAQAKSVFSKGINFTIDSSKSVYGVALDNKALIAGVTGMGVGVLAYKKYPKSAIAAGVAGSAVTAAALTSKYAPEAIEKGKVLAATAGNSVATFAKDAGNYTLETAKSAGNFIAANAVEAAKFVAANTPEIIKNNPVPSALIAGGAAYGAYKAYAPVKNAAKKAGNVIAQKASQVNVGKALAIATPVAVVGLVAYDNQEAIATMAKEVVSSISNGASAVKNAEYAKFGKMAVDSVSQFAVKQYGKLKVNGARLVEAALNTDIKGMALNAGKFLNNHKYEIIGAGTVVVGAGYVADKYVLQNLGSLSECRKAKKLAVRIANAPDIIEISNPEAVIPVDSVTTVADCSPVTQEEADAITSMLDPVYGPESRPSILPEMLRAQANSNKKPVSETRPISLKAFRAKAAANMEEAKQAKRKPVIAATKPA